MPADDGDGARVARWNIAPDALEVLEEVFLVQQFPPIAMRERLAQTLNVTARQIQIWFQNRRQRARQARHSDEDDDHATDEHAALPMDVVPAHSLSRPEKQLPLSSVAAAVAYACGATRVQTAQPAVYVGSPQISAYTPTLPIAQGWCARALSPCRDARARSHGPPRASRRRHAAREAHARAPRRRGGLGELTRAARPHVCARARSPRAGNHMPCRRPSTAWASLRSRPV